MIPKNIRGNLLQYTEYKEQRLLEELLKLQVPESKSQLFCQSLQSILQCSLCDILEESNFNDLYSLLKLMLAAQKNPVFKTRIILFLVDNAVECLQGQRLKIFIQIFLTNYSKFSSIDQSQMYRIHRILNTGLKKLPINPQTITTRGQIHLKITQILGFGHLSGLQYHKQNTEQLEKCMTVIQFEQQYGNSDITYKFYHSYYCLYKCLNTEEEIRIIEELRDHFVNGNVNNYGSNYLSNSNNNNKSKNKKRKKQDKQALVKKLLVNLTNLESYITQILQYLKSTQKQPNSIPSSILTIQHQPQSSHSQISIITQTSLITQQTQTSLVQQPQLISLQPIPYYLNKNFHLQQFKLTIIIQILNYCEYMLQKLKNKQCKNKDQEQNNHSMLEQIISQHEHEEEIEKNITNIRILCQNFVYQRYKGERRYKKLLDLLDKFYVNEAKWILLKYNHKIAKKTIFNILHTNNNNTNVQTNQTNNSKRSFIMQNNPDQRTTSQSSTQIPSIKTAQRQYREQIKNKLCIGQQKMLQFISKSAYPQIKKNVEQPKIAEYLSNCSENVDLHQEQDRNYVHRDKWKARRWVSRFNVKLLDMENLIPKQLVIRKQTIWTSRIKQRSRSSSRQDSLLTQSLE